MIVNVSGDYTRQRTRDNADVRVRPLIPPCCYLLDIV
jgi:hypothetical protein